MSRSTPRPTSAGAINYGSAFLPAHFQGTRISDSGFVPNLKARSTLALQRKQIDLVQAMNRDLSVTPRRPGSARRRDPIVRAGVQDAGQGSRVCSISPRSRNRSSTPTGSRPGPEGKLRPTMPDGPAAQRGPVFRFVEVSQPGWDHHTNLHKGADQQRQGHRPADRSTF